MSTVVAAGSSIANNALTRSRFTVNEAADNRDDYALGRVIAEIILHGKRVYGVE